MTAPLSPPRHLLVHLPNPLGDAVMATPALRALRAALPETRITALGQRAPLAALEGEPAVDAWAPWPRGRARGVAARRVTIAHMRRLQADATLLLPGSFSSAWWAFRARIPVRVGVALHGRGLLLTHRVEVPRASTGRGLAPRAMTEHYADLAAPFGAVVDGPPRLHATPFDAARAAERLAVLPEEAASLPLVAVSPGASFGPSKVLPAARVAEALNALAAKHPMRLVLLAGPGEEALVADVAREVTGPCVSTHEDVPDLGTLKGLLSAADLFLGTDAGPRHLAEALGTPAVVWMGPTDPAWSGHSGAAVVRHEALDCLGCHEATCPLVHHPCMAELDLDRIVAAAVQILGSARRSGDPTPQGLS